MVRSASIAARAAKPSDSFVARHHASSPSTVSSPPSIAPTSRACVTWSVMRRASRIALQSMSGYQPSPATTELSGEVGEAGSATKDMIGSYLDGDRRHDAKGGISPVDHQKGGGGGCGLGLS